MALLTKDSKITGLLKERDRVKKRLEEIERIFTEEKDNEESWPGHASTRYQNAEIERQVYSTHLEMIETELREFGYRENKD